MWHRCVDAPSGLALDICPAKHRLDRWFRDRPAQVATVNASELQGLVLAGTLAGSIFGGMITDWIWRCTRSLRFSRSGVGVASLGACSLLILGAWFVEDITLAVAMLTLGAFFAALAGLLAELWLAANAPSCLRMVALMCTLIL